MPSLKGECVKRMGGFYRSVCSLLHPAAVSHSCVCIYVYMYSNLYCVYNSLCLIKPSCRTPDSLLKKERFQAALQNRPGVWSRAEHLNISTSFLLLFDSFTVRWVVSQLLTWRSCLSDRFAGIHWIIRVSWITQITWNARISVVTKQSFESQESIGIFESIRVESRKEVI